MGKRFDRGSIGMSANIPEGNFPSHSFGELTYRKRNFSGALRCCLPICAFLSFGFSCALAGGTDDSLLEYAASLRLSNRTQSWSGHAIYLGKGLFITAAHVVGRAWLNNPKVATAGREYPTTVVK